MNPITLHWLDNEPAHNCGVTWGCSWPRGELSRDTVVGLRRADGTPVPLQTWPLAFWPEGSIKWLGCAAVLGPADGATFSLVQGGMRRPHHR